MADEQVSVFSLRDKLDSMSASDFEYFASDLDQLLFAADTAVNNGLGWRTSLAQAVEVVRGDLRQAVEVLRENLSD